MNLEDEERPGPPKGVTISDMIEKVHDFILRDGRMKAEEIAKASVYCMCTPYSA